MKRKIKYIGDTMDPELSPPKGPKFNVYADTETYLRIPEGAEPGNCKETTEFTEIMQLSENIPGLLVGSFKSLKKRVKNDEFFEGGGGVMDCSLLWDDMHIRLFHDLQAIYKLKRLPVLIFHNSSFDITAMIKVGKMLDPELVLYTYVKSTNKSFLRGMMYSPKFGFKCELGDTMLFEMVSIETIGISLGKHKGKDVPYTMSNVSIIKGTIHYTDLLDGQRKKFPLEKYIEYAQRDVEIQREYGETLKGKKQLVAKAVIEDPISYDHVKERLRGLTQGSFSKSLVDIYLLQNGFKGGVDGYFRFDIPDEMEQVYQETVKSNMGGYTTFNRDIRHYQCDEDESILVYDCNSEYPYILTQEIPFNKILDKKPKDSDYKTGYIVSFKKCEGKEKMQCLKLTPISNERICPNREIRFYMLKEYYDLIDRLCDHESTIHEVKYQASTKIFKPFIERLYNLRKAYKQSMKLLDSDSDEYKIVEKQQHGCKIIMNSIYGKLCEKSHKEGCFYYSKTNKYKTFLNHVAPYKCILSGSYITYSGRILLLSKIEKCIDAGFKVLYADTDSVMFVSKKGNKKINKIFGEDTGELGQGKCEGEFNLFLNSGVKKKYCLLDTNNPSNYKIAGSGINKAVPKAFQKRLKEGDKDTIEDLKFIFDPKNNVVFKKQKRARILNLSHHQKIIYNTDFQMNKSLKKVSGEVHIINDDYILEKYDG